MMGKKLFAMIFLGLVVFVTMKTVSARAFDEEEVDDEVFVDESEADFEDVPTLPTVQAPTQPPPGLETSLREKEKAQNRVAEEARAAKLKAEDEAKSAQAKIKADEERLKAEKANAARAAEAKAAEAKAAEAKAAEAKAKASAQSAATTPKISSQPSAPQDKVSQSTESVQRPKRSVAQVSGQFARTKQVCPLMSEPAELGEPVTHTKHPRKIWVEEVDQVWYRAYNKAGDPVYIRRDCLE